MIKGYSQNLVNLCDYDTLYKLSDSIYGNNDAIENGTIYKFLNNKITGTPFLTGNKWNNSTLYVSGKKYNKYLAKYDLVNDNFIIKVPLNKTKTVFVRVNKLLVDSFYIGNKKFINTNTFDSCPINKNYVQVLFYGNLSFFKVLSKSFINMYSERDPYGKFSETKFEIYVFDGTKFTKTNKKRALSDLFKDKESRKKINIFLKYYKNNLLKISSKDLLAIMNYCNIIYEKK